MISNFFLIVLIFRVHSKCDSVHKVNPSKDFGVWEGWGTSLAWWANVFGDRDDLADMMFTTKQVHYNNKTVPGLGLNIGRYNVGGSSWNSIGADKMVASPHIPHYKQIQGFWLNDSSEDPNSSSWDWTVDKNQRLMVTKAIARGAEIELFSNSPMWWMLSNHNPSGSENGGENLKKEYYQKFAIYMATVAKEAIHRWNISFVSVEPFNEANSPFWQSEGTQEGCHIGPETQQKVIEFLREELNKRGLNKTIISASDENTYDGATNIWKSFPESIRSKVGRVNVHGYQYDYGRRDALYDLIHKDNKPLWNSEYGEGDASGQSLANNLQEDMFWLHPTAWVYWQPFDIPGWGMVQSNLDAKTLGEVSPKYYVMAQFSRHIRKGMQILETSDSHSVAAYDRKAGRLVIVSVNPDKQQNITYDLSQFSRIPSESVRRWTTNTGSGDRYVEKNDLKIDSKKLTVSLPQKTIQTIEIDNIFV